jgi:DNA-directed RNA polymerase subunit RPC12/RpoP
MPSPLHTLVQLGEKRIHYFCPICKEDDRFETLLTYLPIENSTKRELLPITVLICRTCGHLILFKNTDPDPNPDPEPTN